MNANIFLEKLLGIARPSYISKVQLASKSNTLHIWVKENKGFLDRTESLSCPKCEQASNHEYELNDLSWYHLKIGQYHTVIHTSLPVYKESCKSTECKMLKGWLAPTNLKLSHALSHEIMELINNKVHYSAICNYFNVPLEQVWSAKRQFEAGDLNLEVGKLVPLKEKKAETAKIEITGHTLPPSSDMVWHRLLEGKSSFVTDSLSLKFMLTRLKRILTVMPDEETRRSRINELRQFFMKHERVLGKEISQIQEISNER